MSSLMNLNQRVQSPYTTFMLLCLKKDLKAIYEWQKDFGYIQDDSLVNDSKFHIENMPYTGNIWLLRGVLAERLLKFRLAERAYRIAVKKGFSLYAWYRLMLIHIKNGNPKSVLSCILEIFKYFDKNVVFDKIPLWIEQILSELCRGFGINQLLLICNDINAHEYPSLIKTINKLAYWKVEGSLN